MKKLLIVIAAIIAASVVLSMAGPLVGLAFSALVIFLALHYYVKTNSVFVKVLWISVGLIGVLTAVSNVPALIGLAALVILYALYKKWDNKEAHFDLEVVKEDDPFTNFENEWAKLSK